MHSGEECLKNIRATLLQFESNLQLIKAFSSKKVKGRMMERFNSLNIHPFSDIVSVFNVFVFVSLQFWTCPCARTRRTKMTSPLYPVLSTRTLPSGAPKPAAWRSVSSPVPAHPPSALASTLGASSRPAAGTQAVARARTARTASFWATSPPLPTHSTTVTPSPLPTVTHSPSRRILRAARTQPHTLTLFRLLFPPPALPHAPPMARPRCPLSA